MPAIHAYRQVARLSLEGVSAMASETSGARALLYALSICLCRIYRAFSQAAPDHLPPRDWATGLNNDPPSGEHIETTRGEVTQGGGRFKEEACQEG